MSSSDPTPFDSAAPLPTPDQPIFEARLTPHRSLSPAGFRIVMMIFAAGALVQAVPMTLMGAWPIGWFFGLDILVLYVCFRINFAQARQSEEVFLSRASLRIRRLSARGQITERLFNPFWVRLKTVEDEDYGVQRVLVVQRREEVEIGAFLAPFEKAEFAHAFSGALAKARG